MSNTKKPASPTDQNRTFRRLCIAILSVLAMLAYSAFPLAIFLNRPYFWNGLASILSEPGQPHSTFFTDIDTVASLFGIALFSYLAWKGRRDSKQATALGLVAIASLAELLTDIYTLPLNYSTTGSIPSAHYFSSHPSLIVHLAASSVNSVAFVVSFGLWVLHRRHTKHDSLLRKFIFILALVVGTIGTIIGRIYPETSPTLQRVFILCYCYWFIALPFDSLI